MIINDVNKKNYLSKFICNDCQSYQFLTYILIFLNRHYNIGMYTYAHFFGTSFIIYKKIQRNDKQNSDLKGKKHTSKIRIEESPH